MSFVDDAMKQRVKIILGNWVEYLNISLFFRRNCQLPLPKYSASGEAIAFVTASSQLCWTNPNCADWLLSGSGLGTPTAMLAPSTAWGPRQSGPLCSCHAPRTCTPSCKRWSLLVGLLFTHQVKVINVRLAELNNLFYAFIIKWRHLQMLRR